VDAHAGSSPTRPGEPTEAERAPIGAIALAWPDDDLLWALVAGKPLFAWAVAACEAAPEIAATVLALPSDRVPAAAALATREGWRRTRLLAVAPDATRRRDAVRAALAALSPACGWVMVHDAARPLITPQLIALAFAAAQLTGAATAAEPVKETIKRARDGVVIETLPRAELAQLQTPQVFRRDLLRAAHQQSVPDADLPDDVALALACGITVQTYPAGADHLLVSTPDDLKLAGALLQRRLPPEDTAT
jgi:2-C-methyl-D-erythritol 4-phosphate cytidylyltransferase